MIDFKVYTSSSKGNLYTVGDGHSRVLIEMGLPIRELRKALGFSLSEVSFALLSHCHKDHSVAVADVMKAGIDVYASQGTVEELGLSGHRIHVIQAKKQFTVGSWTVLPLEAQHDAPEPLCFLMANSSGEKLLFATDTSYLKNRFIGLNAIAVECNYELGILHKNVENGLVDPAVKARLIRSHFGLANVKEFLQANDLSKVQAIYLLHLSDNNSDAARFKREIQELTGKEVYIA